MPSETDTMKETKRTITMGFRVTEEERQMILFLAKRDRRTPSDYIRLTLFDFAKTNGNGWKEWLDDKATTSDPD